MSADSSDWHTDEAQRLLCPAPRSKNVLHKVFELKGQIWRSSRNLALKNPSFDSCSRLSTLERTESHIFYSKSRQLM